MTFKMMIAACWLGMALLLQTETGLGQAKVQDISQELWQKLPKDYGLFDCGFIPKLDAKNIWWACQVSQDTDETASSSHALAWLMPIENDGKLGKGVRVDFLADSADPWAFVKAWGQQNVLMVRNGEDKRTITVLKLPSSADQNSFTLPQLWLYTTPKSLNSQENSALIDATPTDDNGYILLMQDFSETAAEKKLDRWIAVRLNAEGKEVWQYTAVKQLPLGVPADEILPVDDLRKWTFLTNDQKTVIYGSTYENADFLGTFLVCLDEKGQEISHQFYKEYDWETYINGINQGFGFINYPHDEDGHIIGVSISPFNKDCQKMPDQVLNLPTHGFKGEIYNEIETTSLTAKGDLVIVYTQQAASAGCEEVDLPPPSMYVSQINSKGEVIQEIPLITGEDENRYYLEVFMGGEGEDPLKITLAMLSPGNELLISIHNMGIDPEVFPELKADFWLPRIYKVKLQ